MTLCGSPLTGTANDAGNRANKKGRPDWPSFFILSGQTACAQAWRSLIIQPCSPQPESLLQEPLPELQPWQPLLQARQPSWSGYDG